jgi:hypothetical protein
VKVVHPHIVGDQEGRERLAREVAAMRRVVGPGVAEVLDADVEADPPYIVTRYVAGLPLDRAVGRDGPLPPADWRNLAADLADALVTIHSAGVVHRDLKPGNVLLADHGAVVIDFGLAQLAGESRITRNGVLLGTPGYLAPEIIDGGHITAASDIHSFAATMAFAASGRPPYGSGSINEVLQRVAAGRCDLSGVPAECTELLRRCLALNPHARPNAWQLHAELEQLSVQLPGGPDWAPPRAGIPATRPFTFPVPVPRHALPAPEPEPMPEPAPALVPAAPGEPLGRRLIVLLCLAFFVSAATVVPVASAIAYFTGLIAMSVAERAATAQAKRRALRGRRRSDSIVSAVLLPWQLVRATLAASGLLLFALATVTIVLGLAWLSGSEADQTWPMSRPTLAVAAAAAVLVSWWGPGGGTPRRGALRTTRLVLPRPVHRFGAGAALVAVAVLLASAPVVPISWPLG